MEIIDGFIFLIVVIVSWLDICVKMFHILNMCCLLHFNYILIKILKSYIHVMVPFLTCGRLKFTLFYYNNYKKDNYQQNDLFTCLIIALVFICPNTSHCVLPSSPFWKKHRLLWCTHCNPGGAGGSLAPPDMADWLMGGPMHLAGPIR